MNRENTPWAPVTPAQLEWTDEGDPLSSTFGDVYYSREDGIAESTHVFLEGNKLAERLVNGDRGSFCIGETGFGTGLNFLLTWQLWRGLPQPRPRLHYVSVEMFPLLRADLERALATWPSLAPLAESLLAHWPDLLPGQHRVILDDGQVTLDLWWEDVAAALPDIASTGPSIDAWFLDGFAPACNEAMWRPELYRAIAAASRQGASFATFTAAGHVRRGLQDCGFQVEKAPGFGHKRECLRGSLAHAVEAPTHDYTPWDLPRKSPHELLNPSPQLTPKTALVIGAGLAGCSTAAALARRGLVVKVLDAGALAGEASGNEQGILYTRLSRRHSVLTDFALQSFTCAAALYRGLFANGRLCAGVDGELCGSFHQQSDADERALLAEQLKSLPQLAAVLEPEEAESLLGVRPREGGYWFPASGWLRPPSVCTALLDHPNIQLIEHCGALSLVRELDHWTARNGQEAIATGSLAIICTGTAASRFEGLEWLPTQAIRGQTSHLPANSQFDTLRAGFCHEGYIAPARNGEHCIGATFNLKDSETSLRHDDHRQNLERLASAVPRWRELIAAIDVEHISGRVGFRCASPDYLPIAGPVPARDAFLHDYAGLRKNAKQTIPALGSYMTDLYVNTAHGSRGLSSTPLVAEILASQICEEPIPMSRELQRALSPARFLVRDLARGRI
ncbi:bifunctional tRNA (5-methylaminomethyl-2-thiouridine)(34)-methyltransferase MnmD/FAD-dependent 5-carboxymethylaminomethyl-2-thiouridine(34) oxidoreductase MnmC [Halioglobus maricola]|uniref:tRNA 5-methylaminomethyl-2-thiouridine biosynthesis bifunctional protein MnmC n=1 Tax=Halioglobus maricola TaxID=2601894 RepID=A0A5P9NIU1_9GAMM|nr:bifunctional tRNA (5-methylaminomethyl-2-thiouridine)(34)-methyltransferase MnmD/FAD-dependent 5-carboxymethylaminomethyl-2-thiouridine(34) oxidoreductase MnmC [Halioglobus maricola]QFU75475.1 bifunctional tRNA (5-methylaminomethyl-2-thiouridine)(34)-methyltransferase MnmD/FAD-dependent 5-carboxymethylaminomethyl-2-thiouridine(34) oxidoreductase MnmC [Halioglobus maricola]